MVSSTALTVKRRWAWCSFMSTFIIFSKSCTSLKFILPSLFLSAFLNQSLIHLGMSFKESVTLSSGWNTQLQLHSTINFTASAVYLPTSQTSTANFNVYNSNAQTVSNTLGSDCQFWHNILKTGSVSTECAADFYGICCGYSWSPED